MNWANTILKSLPETNFTTIRNSFLQDNKLSASARGVGAYLLSLPPDWNIIPENVKKEMQLGRESMTKIFKELEENGYLFKRQSQEKNGRFSKNIFYFSDDKEKIKKLQKSATNIVITRGQPFTEKPSTEKPSTENQYPLQIKQKNKKNNLQKKQQKKEQENVVVEILNFLTEKKINTKPIRRYIAEKNLSLATVKEQVAFAIKKQELGKCKEWEAHLTYMFKADKLLTDPTVEAPKKKPAQKGQVQIITANLEKATAIDGNIPTDTAMKVFNLAREIQKEKPGLDIMIAMNIAKEKLNIS